MANGTAHSYGLSLAGDTGWTALAYRRPADVPGEVTHPVLHACTRPLPAQRGDFGVGVVELLGADDIFVALVEYGSELAGRGLFARRGLPKLAPSQFGPARLQRIVPGRSAAQHFCTEGDRAFCVFVVLGSHARRMALVPRAGRLLAGLTVVDRSTLLRRGIAS